MRRWTVISSVALAVALGVQTGCAGDAGRSRDVTLERVDSSGVEIVLISGSRESIPVVAVLDPIPALRLGSPMGRPEEEFGSIHDVVRLSDGGMAVLDGQAAEVRVFDATGQHQATLGGKGDGPGEFQSPIDLEVLLGDTLAVYDPVPGRVTRLDPSSGASRVTTLVGAEARVSDGRFLGDGQLVGQSHWLASGGAPQPNGEPVLVRNSVALTLYDVMGQIVDTIDRLPSSEEIVSIRMGAGAVSVLKRPPAFARDNLFAPVSAGVWSSQNDRFELRLREASNGRLLRVVRAPSLERPATEELANSIHDRVLREAETAQQRSQLETWFSLSPQPEVQPAFDAFAADDDGRLWVREWSPFQDAMRWWVFEADGTLRGSLDAPSGMRITSATCDSVTGVERDELGVAYAVQYAMNESVLCQPDRR